MSVGCSVELHHLSFFDVLPHTCYVEYNPPTWRSDVKLKSVTLLHSVYGYRVVVSILLCALRDGPPADTVLQRRQSAAIHGAGRNGS